MYPFNDDISGDEVQQLEHLTLENHNPIYCWRTEVR